MKSTPSWRPMSWMYALVDFDYCWPGTSSLEYRTLGSFLSCCPSWCRGHFQMKATLACLLLLIFSLPALGQSNYAMVSGTVRDAQSLPVPKATVQFKALSTGAIRVATTDDRGLF